MCKNYYWEGSIVEPTRVVMVKMGSVNEFYQYLSMASSPCGPLNAPTSESVPFGHEQKIRLGL